jgi:hypothetical protein
MPFHRHQELVLGMGQPGRARLALAPMLETAQAHAESEQMLEVLRGWLRQACPPGLGHYVRSYSGQPDRAVFQPTRVGQPIPAGDVPGDAPGSPLAQTGNQAQCDHIYRNTILLATAAW